ncbi:UNVERIFIED_CONTAM: hypothetical protein RMT77_010263 [Armadillidium vulgare]
MNKMFRMLVLMSFLLLLMGSLSFGEREYEKREEVTRLIRRNDRERLELFRRREMADQQMNYGNPYNYNQYYRYLR